MGRPLFSKALRPPPPPPPAPALDHPPRWSSWDAFDPDADEFFEGADAVYEAFLTPAEAAERDLVRAQAAAMQEMTPAVPLIADGDDGATSSGSASDAEEEAGASSIVAPERHGQTQPIPVVPMPLPPLVERPRTPPAPRLAPALPARSDEAIDLEWMNLSMQSRQVPRPYHHSAEFGPFTNANARLSLAHIVPTRTRLTDFVV